MKTEDLIAIDIHTHAEVSCRNPFDNYGEEYDRAADKYFGSNRRPTIDETDRLLPREEDRPGDVHGRHRVAASAGARIPNEEIAEAAQANTRHDDRLRPASIRTRARWARARRAG